MGQFNRRTEEVDRSSSAGISFCFFLLTPLSVELDAEGFGGSII